MSDIEQMRMSLGDSVIGRDRIKALIGELVAAGVKHGKIALLVPIHQTQLKRISEHGRCEEWVARRLREIHREYVPRGTSQFVTRGPAIEMRMA